MPNASEVKGIQPHKFLLLGNTGSGKTTQILTLPGKKFIYIFDPNSLLSLRGHDIDYEEFLPTQSSFDIKSLKKGVAGDTVMGAKGSEVYVAWERDFDAKVASGFFASYDVIGIDSCTTLLDLIMDRMLTINGRPGTFPQQDDWGPQMVAFTSIMRTLTGMGKMLFLTGHLKTDKDENTQKVFRAPLFTGQLREKIPLLFSDIFLTDVQVDEPSGKVLYQIRTVPDRYGTPIRTSIKGLGVYENVSIDWTKPVVGQGLGGLLNWEQKQIGGDVTAKA